MLRIRLSRKGCKNIPFYNVVVIDSRKSRDGKFIEKVGYYTSLNDYTLYLNIDRIKYWIKNGAKLTKRVSYLIKKKNE